MPVRAVFLVGFMASGKSTVGQQLAHRLGWDFVDLDLRIQEREGQTVAEIFRDRGESGFRLAESDALRDLTTSLERDTVVALGGGAFVPPRNRELVRPWSSVFMETPLDELWKRCMEGSIERPLRRNPVEFARLYELRLPFYRQATVTVVTSGKDPVSLCAEIERTLQFRGETVGAEAEGEGSSQAPPAHFGTGESQ